MTNKTETTGKPVGCIDKTEPKNAHQIQLWIESNGDTWRYIIYNAFIPGGVQTRRGTLDSGSFEADYDQVVAQGRKAFANFSS